MGIAIVAMVNNTAVSENLKEKSESCLDSIANSTLEEDTLHGAQVCLIFKIFNCILKINNRIGFHFHMLENVNCI